MDPAKEPSNRSNRNTDTEALPPSLPLISDSASYDKAAQAVLELPEDAYRALMDLRVRYRQERSLVHRVVMLLKAVEIIRERHGSEKE